MMISMIVALSKNFVIGVNNQLPWHLPADLRYFKSVTLGKPIVMGRKTFESIGRPLPGRENIILTRDIHYQAPGCLVVDDIKALLKKYESKNIEELMIIGGAQIFEQFLPRADRLYLTYVEVDLVGDVFFPSFNLKEWQEVSRIIYPHDEKNQYDCTFVVLDRIKKE